MNSSGEVTLTTCTPGSAALGDSKCRAVSPGLLRAGYLKAVPGDTTGADFVQANVRPESFFCRPAEADPTVGACRYRPFFQRLNVVPDRLEAVWFNGDDVVGTTPRTVDYFFLRAFKPSAVPTPLECLADYREKGPTGIPFYAE